MKRAFAALPITLALACAAHPPAVRARAPHAGAAVSSPSIAPPPASSTAADALPAPPAPTPVDPRLARLARLARLWGDVQYHDPYLWDRAVDWDGALVAALPKVSAAKGDDEEAAAVQAMLDALHDPSTKVEAAEPDEPPPASADTSKTSTRWATHDVLVVKLALHEWGEMGSLVASLRADIAKAKAVIFDLRAVSEYAAAMTSYGLTEIGDALVSHESSVPTARRVVHFGYRPQTGGSSGGYSTAFVSDAATSFVPTPGPHPTRVVFVVNPASELPDVAFAMQHAGDAKIVAQGPVKSREEGTRAADPVGENKVARYRTQELEGAVGPDLTLPDAPGVVEGGAALDAALQLARDGWARRAPSAAATLPAARWRPDPTYPDEAYPSREHRLLALFRFWNVIRLFYPYQHLLEPGAWERVLTDFIPPMEDAGDARAYALAVARLAAQIPDSHVHVDSKELREFIGRALYEIEIRRVEGLPVITATRGTASAAGLRVGDVIVAVDGVPFEERAARVRPYVAASNAWTLARNVDPWATAGARDSEAVVRVRGADEKERDVRVKRVPWSDPPPASGPSYKTLAGDAIGYVDLGALTEAEVDPMFQALAGTRAIVFDMRSYPNGTAWAIAPHLNTRGATAGAQFFRQLVDGRYNDVDVHEMFFQALPKRDVPKYRGKTVMLIDERTQSQAEHTGLFFEAANGTKFIGSPSAGANGDVTNVCLPGNICIDFTGHDVRHADGRQLQRVGLQPDVVVRPTLAGVRAGRDEVLERALKYLREGA